MRAKLAGVGLFAAVLALATWAPAQEATPTTITDIRQESSDRSTRLVVECTGPLAYTYYSPDPLTLVVDIPEVDASQVPARINVGTREVESVRVTSLARADGRNLARVEVRLASLVPYQIFSKDKALNLVFERPASLGRGASPPAAAAPAGAGRRVGASRPPRCAPPAAPEPAAAGRAGEPRDGPEGDAASSRSRATRSAACSPSRSRPTAGSSYRDFMLPNPDRLVVDFADVTRARDVARSRSARTRCARCGWASSAPSRRRWRGSSLDLSATCSLPDHRRRRRGADRVRRERRARGRDPRAARRHAAPRSRSRVEPAPAPGRSRPRARPAAVEPLAPAAAARAAGAGARGGRPRSALRTRRNIGHGLRRRRATSAPRSASTSRTATSRTSSASSRTSPASTSS